MVGAQGLKWAPLNGHLKWALKWRTVGCELGKVDGGGQYLEAVADLFLISKSQKAGPMAHPTHLTPWS